MSMKSINFDTGVKRYALNGDENNCIEINVCDPNVIARFERLQPVLEAELDKVNGFWELDTAERTALDTKLKNLLDEMFDADISSKVFGNASCLSPLASGEIFIMAFLDAFIPVIGKDISFAQKSFMKNSAKKAEKYIADSESAELKPGDAE